MKAASGNKLRSACATVLIVMGSVDPSQAEAVLSGHLEMGFGPTFVRPLVVQGASGFTSSAGIQRTVRPSLRAGLEVQATIGGELLRYAYFDPPPKPGTRTLTSILLGIEASPSRKGQGAFGFVGVGAGRMNLKNATGNFSYADPSGYHIPNRNLTAFAAGLGMGYRFRGGPGWTAFQIALRTHALIDRGRLPASTFALTIGFATPDEPRRPRPKGPKHEGHAITAWPR